MKRTKHPSIIKYEALYFDLRQRKGWLVMELVRFPSLQKLKVSSEEDLKNIVFQIMEGLSYLHQQDIVHRDIKPENILYDSQTKTIKFIDFGISKRCRRRGALVDMWTITGTLYYRAPEMLAGGYREAVDIWATGVLLYKLVTGKTPFESEYHHQTIQNIRGQDLTFPAEFNKHSFELKNMVSMMLERNIDSRPRACVLTKDLWFSSLSSMQVISKKGLTARNDMSYNVKMHPMQKGLKSDMSMQIAEDSCSKITQ